MRFISFVFIIIVIGFMIGFVLLNYQEKVNVDIFGYQIESVSLFMVCLIAFVAGMVFVLIFALADEIALRTQLHRLRKENKHFQEELTSLRNLPFEDEQ